MESRVREFLTSLEAQLTYSPSTRLAYDNDLRCFMGYLQKELTRPPEMGDFTAQQVANFLQAEREAGRRPSTLLRRRASLRRFAIFLSEQNPIWTADFSSQSRLIDAAILTPSPLQKPRYLTEEQVNTLWSVLEASQRPRARRDQAILALLLESGLTVGTLIALNLDDADFDAGQECLRLSKNPDIWVSLGHAVGPLKRYLKEGRPELNYHIDEPALFISQTGGRMSRQGVWQVLRQWGHRAKLPVTLSPRLARHTAAYRLAVTGRPLPEIQVLLGHSNPLSTHALLRRLISGDGPEAVLEGEEEGLAV